jgi:hypothetical protein
VEAADHLPAKQTCAGTARRRRSVSRRGSVEDGWSIRRQARRVGVRRARVAPRRIGTDRPTNRPTRRTLRSAACPSPHLLKISYAGRGG